MPGLDPRKVSDWVMCEVCHKRLYRSKEKARLATRTARNSIRIYRCPHHAGWHATNRGH
jgi:hypothetical protein